MNIINWYYLSWAPHIELEGYQGKVSVGECVVIKGQHVSPFPRHEGAAFCGR
nr:hypothetical protein [Vibrio neptunius]